MVEIIVIIPVKNEEEGIGNVIKQLTESNPAISNIIVIDGRSKDGTKEIAEALGVEIFEGEGRGKGRDLRLFFETHDIDGGDIYVMMDGDDTYDTKDLEHLLQPIIEGDADVVMGSRIKELMEQGAMRRGMYFGNRLLTFTAKLLYGKWDLKDLCTGYWAFNNKALENIAITAEGFDLEANLFAYFVKSKYRIAHVPIHYRKREGKSKLEWNHDGGKIFSRLIKDRFWK